MDGSYFGIKLYIATIAFLATLVALHFTLVSKSVSQWLSGQSSKLA